MPCTPRLRSSTASAGAKSCWDNACLPDPLLLKRARSSKAACGFQQSWGWVCSAPIAFRMLTLACIAQGRERERESERETASASNETSQWQREVGKTCRRREGDRKRGERWKEALYLVPYTLYSHKMSPLAQLRSVLPNPRDDLIPPSMFKTRLVLREAGLEFNPLRSWVTGPCAAKP